jgi:hypothetical protein
MLVPGCHPCVCEAHPAGDLQLLPKTCLLLSNSSFSACKKQCLCVEAESHVNTCMLLPGFLGQPVCEPLCDSTSCMLWSMCCFAIYNVITIYMCPHVAMPLPFKQ